eukprot:3441151-Pyramimonas_sp.AAC.1
MLWSGRYLTPERRAAVDGYSKLHCRACGAEYGNYGHIWLGCPKLLEVPPGSSLPPLPEALGATRAMLAELGS